MLLKDAKVFYLLYYSLYNDHSLIRIKISIMLTTNSWLYLYTLIHKVRFIFLHINRILNVMHLYMFIFSQAMFRCLDR